MHRRDDRRHARIAIQMRRLVKGAMPFALDRAEVQEPDPRAEPIDDARQVVVRARAKRSGAEAQPVRRIGYAVEQGGQVRFGADDARQTEDGKGWIVGMHDQADAKRVGDRADRLEKRDMVRAQTVGIDVGIARDCCRECCGREAFLTARQPGDDRSFQDVPLVRGHRREPCRRTVANLRRVVGLGRRAPQDMQVVHRDRIPFEAQRARIVGQPPVEVGPRPVEQRHEIVRDDRDAVRRQVAQALSIGLDQRGGIGATGLDVLMDRQALDDRPFQPGRLDHGLARRDRATGPHRAVGHVVQRGDDPGRAGLTDLGELHRIGGPEPAHGLGHQHPGIPSQPSPHAASNSATLIRIAHPTV